MKKKSRRSPGQVAVSSPYAAEYEALLWESYNHLMLAPELGRVRKMLARYEMFRRTLDVPGDIFEMGVFKGVGLMFWLKLLTIFESNSSKKVVGFDTFAGFKQSSLLKYEKKSAAIYSKQAKFQKFDTKAFEENVHRLGSSHGCELIDGDVTRSVATYLRKKPGLRISLLHLDLDTYRGTKATLEACWPHLSRGAVVLFDEYATPGWGESDAADEFLKKRKIKLLKVPHAESPTAYFIV